MKKLVALVLSLLLLCSLCIVPVYADDYNSDVTVSADLNKTELPFSSSAQTVVLSIDTSSVVDLFSIGYKVEVPTGWSILDISSGSSNITYSLAEGHYSLSTGVVSWFRATNLSNRGTIGSIKISVPANTPVGEYTIDVTGIELATEGENNDDAWLSNESVSVTLTIKEVPVLTGIGIKTAPNVTDYVIGQNFSSKGMVVEAYYSDGSSSVVTGWTVLDGRYLSEDQEYVTISYTEGGITKTTTVDITVSEKDLVGISIVSYPKKTSYIVGQDFDPKGLEVKAIYSDGSSIFVGDWEITDGKALTFGTRYVTLSYSEGGVTFIETLTISVSNKVMKSIEVKTAPSKTAYIAGQNFDPAGMVIEAVYNDGIKEVVTDWTVTGGTALTIGTTFVTITYTEGKVTKTVTQAITVSAKALTGISVKTAPTATSYLAGQNFDSKGMTIEAAYNDGTKAVVTGWTVTDGTALTAGKTSVTISYTEGGVTKTATQAISVSTKSVESIVIKTAPTKTFYVAGENFDPAGMTVEATYSDGTKAVVTGWTVTDGTALTAGKTSVTISYTEGGVTKTATQAITVSAKAISSITVKTNPEKTSYRAGQKFDATGLVITIVYNDGTTEDITTGFTVSEDKLTADTDFVTVTYGDKTVTIPVTVNSLLVPAIIAGGALLLIIAAIVVIIIVSSKKKKKKSDGGAYSF